ncbi:MAG TPA: hypothetical protein VK605_04610 [Solirubrobacteraceae bacterium]|nr:hypothetical protein [Solirubrobacteraceae bacterium]
MDTTQHEDISDVSALNLALLVLEPRSWINRRVEQVGYLDEKTVRRRITIDFTVPRFEDGSESLPYVPVAQLAKHKLVNFDLRDASGSALPMLTAEHNERLSSSLLLAVARRVGGDDVDSITEKYIPKLVGGTPDEREFAWRRIFPPDGPVGDRLLEISWLKTLATEVRNNFILYMPIGAWDSGARRIIKLAFEAPRPAVDPKGLTARLGWRDVPDSFEVPLAGYCGSYHFEVEAPPEMEVTSGTFDGTQNGDSVQDFISSPTRRAHFNLSGLDRSSGLVTVLLRAHSRDLLGGAALFSALNALVLLFVFLRLSEFVNENGIDAVVATLLVIPGLLVGYVARPSEHALLTSFLTGLRLIAMTSAGTSYAGALVLFAGYHEHVLRIVIGSLFVIALLMSLALIRTWAGRVR